MLPLSTLLYKVEVSLDAIESLFFFTGVWPNTLAEASSEAHSSHQDPCLTILGFALKDGSEWGGNRSRGKLVGQTSQTKNPMRSILPANSLGISSLSSMVSVWYTFGSIHPNNLLAKWPARWARFMHLCTYHNGLWWAGHEFSVRSKMISPKNTRNLWKDWSAGVLLPTRPNPDLRAQSRFHYRSRINKTRPSTLLRQVVGCIGMVFEFSSNYFVIVRSKGIHRNFRAIVTIALGVWCIVIVHQTDHRLGSGHQFVRIRPKIKMIFHVCHCAMISPIKPVSSLRPLHP